MDIDRKECDTDTDRLPLLGSLALLSNASFIIIALALSVVLPSIQHAFASEPHAIIVTTMAATSPMLIFAVAALFAARPIAHFGYRNVLIASLALYATAGVLGGLVETLYLLLASRLLLGLSLAGITTAALTGIGLLEEPVRARMLGLQAVAGNASAIIIFPLMGLLGALGWRWAFAIHLFAALILLSALTLPKAPRSIAASASIETSSTARVALQTLLLSVFFGLSLILIIVMVPFKLRDTGITNPAILALPMTLAGMSSIPTGILYGYFHKRFGTARMFVPAAACCTAGLLLAGIGTSLPMLAPAAALVVIGFTLGIPNAFAAAIASVRPERTGSAVGAVTFSIYSVQSILPLLLIPFGDNPGSISALFLYSGAIGVGVTFVQVMATRRYHTMD